MAARKRTKIHEKLLCESFSKLSGALNCSSRVTMIRKVEFRAEGFGFEFAFLKLRRDTNRPPSFRKRATFILV